MLIFLFFSVVDSQATPIKPDVQKLLQQSQQTQKPFIPARTGWNEPVASAAATHNPVLESIQDDHMRQEFKETLASIATPDPWIAFAIFMVVVLMRKLRSMEAQRRRGMAVAMMTESEPAQPRLAA
ncbi:MAG TPA: hypothetical protein VGL89_09415 [Candidatus Koribacter sp.]